MTSVNGRENERREVELMRTLIFNHYGNSCACCHTTEDLGIDHVNGDGKAQRIALFGCNRVSGRMYRWIIEHGFPDDFQTMCRPCNSSKSDDSDRCRLYHGELAEHEKWCTGCLRIRDARTDFHKHAAGRDGLADRCKECNVQAQADWRERHGTSRVVSVRPGTVGGRILAYLEEHGQSEHAAIVAGTGASFASVSVNLTGLVKAGHVERPKARTYCLPGADELTDEEKWFADLMRQARANEARDNGRELC
jgi:hypothetical protein